MAHGFSPKGTGHPTFVQHGTHLLQQCAVQTLRDAIVLRGVVHGKFLLSSRCLEVHDKLFAKVLAAPIGV
jgi:hypothetical protein